MNKNQLERTNQLWFRILPEKRPESGHFLSSSRHRLGSLEPDRAKSHVVAPLLAAGEESEVAVNHRDEGGEIGGHGSTDDLAKAGDP